VRAHGSVTQEELDRLRGGITIAGIRYGPIEAIADRSQGANVWLTFSMREGKNREVKNVLGHLGLAVNRLIRVSFGPFTLGDLAPGEVEEVRTRTLREQLGERLTTLADADFSGPRGVADSLSGIGRTPASLDKGRAAEYEPRRRGKRGLLPPPLWGRAGEGGGAIVTSATRCGTPTPNPSPQGGGERTETAARSFSEKHSRAGESKRNRADAPERAPREKRRRGRPTRSRRR
jgi:hypothetical protein